MNIIVKYYHQIHRKYYWVLVLIVVMNVIDVIQTFVSNVMLIIKCSSFVLISSKLHERQRNKMLYSIYSKCDLLNEYNSNSSRWNIFYQPWNVTIQHPKAILWLDSWYTLCNINRQVDLTFSKNLILSVIPFYYQQNIITYMLN